MMSNPIIIMGAGGHAKVLVDTLLMLGRTIVGLTDRDMNKVGSEVLGMSVLGADDVLRDFPPGSVELVNALGTTTDTRARQNLYATYKGHGYQFAPIIHPSAILSSAIVLGEGVQVMAGAVIQPGSSVGDNCIINTSASIDHDCVIEGHVHLAPGVTLSGKVCIGEGAHLGTGASVIQGMSIGSGALVAAGSVVAENVPDQAQVKGVPAKQYG
jgi:sugar O-acyltransferase (sialic acid O-acetyltransferase NeuD family)